MERDPPAPAPFAVNPQRDLLSHRPGRHPDRRLFAEQRGDTSLEPFRERALAVAVSLLVRRRSLSESTQRRPRVTLEWRKRADNALTSSPNCRSVSFFGHGPSLRGAPRPIAFSVRRRECSSS
jgi:hypothetical protein